MQPTSSLPDALPPAFPGLLRVALLPALITLGCAIAFGLTTLKPTPQTHSPSSNPPPSSTTASTTAKPATALYPHPAALDNDQQRRAQPYPRQPWTLRDDTARNPSFSTFHQQLQRIVQQRDAAALRQIAAPRIALSFGRSLSLTDLKIDQPNAPIWAILERTLAGGCTEDPSPKPYWACPSAFLAPLHASSDGVKLDGLTDVMILGTDVAVRSRPSLHSPAIATVSNEILHTQPIPDYEPMKTRSVEDLQALNRWYEQSETASGWKYISLPDGRKGFISSRHAFSPIGYRALFEQTPQGQWQMTAFIAGD